MTDAKCCPSVDFWSAHQCDLSEGHEGAHIADDGDGMIGWANVR